MQVNSFNHPSAEASLTLITLSNADQTRIHPVTRTRSIYGLHRIENNEICYAGDIWVGDNISLAGKVERIDIPGGSWAMYFLKDKISTLIGVFQSKPTHGNVAYTIGSWMSTKVGMIQTTHLAAGELNEDQVQNFDEVLNVSLTLLNIKVGLQQCKIDKMFAEVFKRDL